MIRRALPLLLVVAACTPPPPAPAPAPADAPVRELPRQPTPPRLVPGPTWQAPLPPGAALGAIHWWRNSAEHDAIFAQTYAWAGQRLRELAANERRGAWAVILDADETVLDNSTYQVRRNGQGLAYSGETWNAWAREEAAPATPGSVEFIQLVHQLGGRVAIVTNRDDEICPQTRSNLRKIGAVADVVLCRVNGQSDKNPRFQAVQSGTGTGLPPLKVLMWVGDNIQDFPAMGQEIRDRPASAYAEFGRRFIVLPNPMYGSWERNPLN